MKQSNEYKTTSNDKLLRRAQEKFELHNLLNKQLKQSNESDNK